MTVGGTLNGPGGRSFTGNVNGDPTFHEDRHTIGVDARWRLAGFGLDPTFYYQFGHADTVGFVTGPGATNRAAASAIKKDSADISAFFLDVIASYQLGPLLLEGRGMCSRGNKARDNLSTGIHYFQPLDTDGTYWAGGWTQFWSAGVDYINRGWATTGNYVGYDRYGRIGAAARATYNVTPALSLYAVVNAM
jgi:hypothetical protein